MDAPKPTPRKSWKRRLLLDALLVVGGLTIAVGVMIVLILRAWAVPMGDYDTVHPVPKIAGIVAPLAPEKQVEKHTCGLHAVSSIYLSYGLDPEERRLRPRLGVDTSANVYDSETTGSLHPDIFRVLAQDGFVCRSLDLGDARSKKALTNHLSQLRYALALIKRRENGNMHWVVLCGATDTKVRVCDSLKPDTYKEPLDDYWAKCLLSVILITPSSADQRTSVWRLHLRGALEMYRAYQRK